MNKNIKLVYSTNQNLVKETVQKGFLPINQQQIRISRNSKHKGGKTVTEIVGFQNGKEYLENLAKELKQLCGSGGTVKDNVIEIQGDHREKVLKKLTELGYKPKLSGG
ncbi:stress response translation initiation inhibitor YciH [bacterium]|nr:stress response translation initiation inhibitor YciH [bacterium]